MTDLYAVMGKPILHSRSPEMHNAAFAALGMDARYVRIAAESAEEGLRLAEGLGAKGMNVTSPFKDITGLMDDVDALAEKAGAVNTVLLEDGQKLGYNTDVDGAAQAFIANGAELKGERALVLGAGGAAKAAVVAMLENGAKVVVANRTVEKAEALGKGFGIGVCALHDLDGLEEAMADCSLVVGCMSTTERALPEGLLTSEMAVMDAHYASESALARDARKAGCRVLDGREWLLHQGAKAFELFTGKQAPVEAMRKAVYAQNAKPETGNIALVGMMGSGKNATAKALGRLSGMGMLDTDAEIERKTGKRINEIFESHGQERFREMECLEIAASAKTRKTIINCGGGAVLDAKNRTDLKQNAMVVWLWARPEVIVARVAGDDSRPLLGVPDHEKEEILSMLLENRRGLYAETADLVIDTSERAPDEIAERIMYETDKARQG